MKILTFELTDAKNGKLAIDIEKVIAVDIDKADYKSCDNLVKKIEKHIKK